MLEELKDIKGTSWELKKFAKNMVIVFALLGLLFFWRQKSIYLYFLGLAFLFLILGRYFKSQLKFVYKAWMFLSLILGWIMTRLILSLLFFLVLTPIGLLAKLTGKKFLNLKIDKSIDTYWVEKSPQDFKSEDYLRQF
ncbi:MAG: hypothetical protein KBB01_06825 [Candidatus Omnitrophica bacterium]|jgi:predicted membrane protein|nr:hypothetical protein [Candidatus Omnitrophota bacterium]